MCKLFREKSAMIKTSLTTFALCILAFAASAQTTFSVKGSDGKYKYGLKDQSGKEIVPAKYDYIFSTDEYGYFTVELNKKRGFIDATGKEVIPPLYDQAVRFYEGLANVKLNNKWGFIDKTGKEIIPFIYDDAGSFSDGLADVTLNGKKGFIDKTGKEIIPCKYDKVGSFADGLATINLGGKWGLINQSGKEILSPKYDEIDEYGGFPARVGLNNKYGFIDKTGKEVITPKYDEARSFRQGLTAAKLNGKWGIIDMTGKAITPFKYNYTDYQTSVVDPDPVFADGLLRVATGNVKWNSGDYFGGTWGFINKTGKEIVPLKYHSIQPFSEGLALVAIKVGNKSVEDDDDEEEVDNSTYKYGYINKAGVVVIPLKFDEAGRFKKGRAEVTLKGRSFYIDKTGKEVK
jgi:hypothetical protein